MLENKDVKLISINDIVPNRFQPRQIFNENELNELADSIKQHGIIQPLILRTLGDKYEIIAGERRYRAAIIAGLYSVPSIIVDKDDDESAEIAIIENIQRKDLTPIEEAKSYKKLLNRGLTQEEIAQKLGVTQPTIANKLRLLNLTEEVQDALLRNRISERHARALLKLESPQEQVDMLNRIINEKINVKQSEEEIDSLLGYSKPTEELEIPVFEDMIPSIKPIETIQPVEEKEKIEVLSPFTSEEILTIDDEPSENNENTEDLFKPVEEEIKDFSIPSIEDLESPNEIEKVDSKENKYKYLDTVDKVRDFITSIKSNDIKITSEEYDMDNEYQIIIRIEK